MKQVFKLTVLVLLITLLVGCGIHSSENIKQKCPQWTKFSGQCILKAEFHRNDTDVHDIDLSDWEMARIIVFGKVIVKQNENIEIRDEENNLVDSRSAILSGEYILYLDRTSSEKMKSKISFESILNTYSTISVEYCRLSPE